VTVAVDATRPTAPPFRVTACVFASATRAGTAGSVTDGVPWPAGRVREAEANRPRPAAAHSAPDGGCSREDFGCSRSTGPRPKPRGGARAVGGVRSGVMEIWINPACSKCRSALSLLDAEGAEYTVRRYLEEPPTTAELEGVLARLGLEPWDIARTGEAIAGELGMRTWAREEAERGRWIAALAEHPILIQRPIITADDGSAVVARTPEAVRSVLD
jgi:arsenate reductase (glutaredoxin)